MYAWITMNGSFCTTGAVVNILTIEVELLFMAFLFGWATGLTETGVRTQRIEVLVKVVHVRL